MSLWPFHIDKDLSCEQHLHITVAGMGDVVIHVNKEGLEVVVYPVRRDGGEDALADIAVSLEDMLNPPTKD